MSSEEKILEKRAVKRLELVRRVDNLYQSCCSSGNGEARKSEKRNKQQISTSSGGSWILNPLLQTIRDLNTDGGEHWREGFHKNCTWSQDGLINFCWLLKNKSKKLELGFIEFPAGDISEEAAVSVRSGRNPLIWKEALLHCWLVRAKHKGNQ